MKGLRRVSFFFLLKGRAVWSIEIQKDLRSVSIIGRACLQAVTGGGGALVTKSYLTFVTPWTVAHQASLSMGFSRQEYWSGLPFPSPETLYFLH